MYKKELITSGNVIQSTIDIDLPTLKVELEQEIGEASILKISDSEYRSQDIKNIEIGNGVLVLTIDKNTFKDPLEIQIMNTTNGGDRYEIIYTKI